MPKSWEPNTESPAAIGPDNSAASEEAAKKGGRTLKLKGAESEASEDKPTEAPAQTAPEGETNTDEGAPQGRARRGRQRRPRRDPNTPSANPMSLTELKNKSTQELIDMAREMGIENMARSRNPDIIFALLKRHAKSGEDHDGVLEILQDGLPALRRQLSLQAPTTSTSARVKFVALISVPVTP